MSRLVLALSLALLSPVLLAPVLPAPICLAVTMDRETHDALIRELESVRENLKKDDVSFVPSTLRLADLLADRSRLIYLTNTSDPQILGDRMRAIDLISSVEGRLPADQKAKVDLQKAQLYQLVGSEDKSMEILLSIRREAKGSKTDEYWAATDLLADVEFSHGQFAKARSYYEEINASEKKNDFANYRIAWCDLNQGHEERAVSRMETLLEKQKLEEGLRKEATRDLVLFYARLPFKPRNIDKIKKYSSRSQSDAQENLRVYGEELKRLGRKKESATVLLQYMNITHGAKGDLVAQANLFENLIDINRYQDAVSLLGKIVAASCNESVGGDAATGNCADVQNTIHRSLRGWAAAETNHPSHQLFKAFEVYSRQRPVDEAALLFGVKVAQDNENHREALVILAALTAEAKDPKILETALGAQILSAEKAKDLARQEPAYRDYLRRGTDEKIKTQVLTALVRVLIERKNFVEAENLTVSCLQKKFDRETGDLLLEVYKRSHQVEKERELALRLSQGRLDSDYFQQYKRLSADVVKTRIEQNKASHEDLALLIELAQKSQNPSEKFHTLNDAYLVALQLRDIAGLKRVGDQLVELAPRLASAERRLAYEKRMFVADLELDFAGSLKFEKMIDGNENVFRKVLKARLAHRPDRPAEREIMRESRFSDEQKMWVLEQQVVEDANPLLALSQAESFLSRHKEQHSRLVLTALGRTAPWRVEDYVLHHQGLRGSFVDVMMRRRVALREMNKDIHHLLRSHVGGTTVASFGRSLEQSGQGLLNFSNRFISGTNDVVIVMIAKSNLIKVQKKLMQDLLAARGRLRVSRQHRIAFEQTLRKEILTMNQQVTQLNSDIQIQWEKENIETSFDQVLQISHPLQKRALAEEISFWRSFSQDPLQGRWAQVLRHLRPSDEGGAENISSLFNSIRHHPFEKEYAQRLIRAEESRGNHLMAAFISDRSRSMGGVE
ncbi:MAG: hypothetical protein C5B49_06250 [Bdellovibrio sp.]|nr:MAG: hypothetical protein C5B49_06250 [Bdellovibrio sp.]